MDANFLAFEDVLCERDFTPDIIPEIDTTELAMLLGAKPATILKLKRFALKWTACLELKEEVDHA